jgi:hypothetical protein
MIIRAAAQQFDTTEHDIRNDIRYPRSRHVVIVLTLWRLTAPSTSPPPFRTQHL